MTARLYSLMVTYRLSLSPTCCLYEYFSSFATLRLYSLMFTFGFKFEFYVLFVRVFFFIREG